MIEIYDRDEKKWHSVCDNPDFKVQGTEIEAHDQFYINNRYYPTSKYDWSKTKYPDSIEVSNAPLAHLNGIYERDTSAPNIVPVYGFDSSDKNIMPEGFSSAMNILQYFEDDFLGVEFSGKFCIWSLLFDDDDADSFWVRLYYCTGEDFFTKDSVTWYLWEDGSEVSFTITKKYD